MAERKGQIQRRMEDVKQAQQESLERREELVRDLELANQKTRRDEQEQERLKVERKREIDAQVRHWHNLILQ